MLLRRASCLPILLLIGFLTLPLKSQASEDDLTFFRIGTGGLDGIYYPMGGLIASTISNPPGRQDCERGGKCGVPGLIAVAKSSDGSISNLSGLLKGELDSAFVQADVLFAAYQGSGIFEGQPPLDELRVLSSLFEESIHVVTRKDLYMTTFNDLKGKRVSLGVKNSDAFIESQMLLDTFHIKMEEITAFNLSPAEAAQALREGKLDAFFMISGYPSQIITQLAEDNLIDLLPLSGELASTLMDKHQFLSRDLIPDGTYPDLGPVETLSIATIWVTTLSLDEQLAYQILQSLWHENNRSTFDNAIEAARSIQYSNSFLGVKTPIHPGAMLFHELYEVSKAQDLLKLDQPEAGLLDHLFEASAQEPKEN